MIPRHHSSASTSGPRHSRRTREHRVWRGVSIGVVGVLVFGVSSAAAVAAKLQNNIHRVDIAAYVPIVTTSASTNPQDTGAGTAMNILLIGSDQRNGENAVIGGANPGMHSDTAIVMHVSADRTRVELVSIPRDSMVQIPSCKTKNGTTRAFAKDMFNKAFDLGWNSGGDIQSAAACTWNTVQVNTGIKIDHTIVVDFEGFQKMIDAVGGVDICFASNVHDIYTGLSETAGMHHLGGTEALQFARARHGTGLGDGSDIDRIKRQQQLLGSLAHEVLSRNVLTNGPALLSFASAATSSLTVDAGFNLSAITGLAYGLRNVSGANIVFMTIPWALDPTDTNRVIWTSGAKAIWADIASDTPIVPQTAATAAPSAVATPSPTATSPKGVTSVQDVQNQQAATCAA